MQRTRLFQSGDGQAVRIPAEIAYTDPVREMMISRHGDVIMLHPLPTGLREAVERLRAMPRPTEIESREPIDMPDRA